MTDPATQEHVLQDYADPLQPAIASRVKHDRTANRVFELTRIDNNVTHRQPTIEVYVIKDAALFTGNALSRGYSVHIDGLTRTTNQVIRNTEFVITYYNIDYLTDPMVRDLGGPIAKERFAGCEESRGDA